MKRRDSLRRRGFWGKWLDLWLVCWVVYCAGEYLLLSLFYRETMPHLRDYSVLGWTQHLVFAAVYFFIFTRPACRPDPSEPPADFHLRKIPGELFRFHWRQMLVLLGCAILYETIQFMFPDRNNLFSALLAVLFPSASVIPAPVIRTVVGVSLTLASMLLPHILLRYGEAKRQRAEKSTSLH